MIAPDEHGRVENSDERLQGQKKPYASPRLTIHGRIEEITAAGGVTGVDVPVGSMLI